MSNAKTRKYFKNVFLRDFSTKLSTFSTYFSLKIAENLKKLTKNIGKTIFNNKILTDQLNSGA